MNVPAIFAIGRAITEAGQGGRLLSAGVDFEPIAIPLLTHTPLATVLQSIPSMTPAERKALRAGCHAIVDLVFDCEEDPKAAAPVANGLAALFPVKS